ncbi:MAG: rhamnogalacturonan acetylesterase [Bacteroidaceae bacterium]|jgi:lysophospholipase L1-like esterase|nr:rhamnogalacturonan acetylesterase [Bacteroidaceae bacterium]MDY6258049.1 rhamnogalacturonan acetylesterase [Bacteroidaceae bacterium]
MKKILSLLVFSFSLLTSYAQHDIWIDINGVRDLTADSIDIANQVRPVPGSSRRGNNPVLFLVGNSTMRTGTLGNGNNGQWGWGFYAHEYYDENKITVENHALGGTSPRTFYTMLWQPVLEAVKKGDYVFLELGHNDNGPIDSIRARSSYRPDGKLEVKEDSISIYNKVTRKQETVYTFGGYMRRFINEIRAKGATPILFTLTPRNDYEADNPKRIQRKLSDFTPAIFAIGKETNTPVIDLNDISATKLEQYGPWKTNYHFYLDKIHSSAYGARMNAASAAEGILASNDPQVAFLKSCLNDRVNPKRCDQNRQQGKPMVFLCGDSTGKNEDSNPDGMWGWGSQGYTVFDANKCVFQNQAKAGRSTRTYIDEGRWDEVYNSLQKGDVVLIQFGHNDIGGIKDGKERGVIASAKDSCAVYRMESSGIYQVIYSYGWYLKKMIRDTQEKGAIPVLLSLTPRNEWHEGNGHSRGFIYPVKEKTGKSYIERRNETYGSWCRTVARETGCEFVDIHNITANALDKMGPKKAASYFKNDHTHTSLKGAQLNAQSLAKGLRDIQSPVAWLLK